LAIAGAPAPAEICYTGTWAIKFHKTDALLFDLHYPAGFSNWSRPADLKCIGITIDQLNSSNSSVAFKIGREAGTFACSGEAGGGTAAGTFRFHPDSEWANRVGAMGLRCSLSDQVIAAMADIPIAYVRAIVDAGYKSNSLKGLFGLKMHGISVEQAQTLWHDFPDADSVSIMSLIALRDRMVDLHLLHEAFPEASIDEVVTLGMSGVTPELISALRLAGVHNLTAANVIALRSVGIDHAFADRLSAAGKTNLSVDEVAALKKSGF
jgi:hypothetical protein